MSHVSGETDGTHLFLSHVPSGFNIFFGRIIRINLSTASGATHYDIRTVFRLISKHTTKPQRDSKSKRNISTFQGYTRFRFYEILIIFKNVLVAPVPLTICLCEKLVVLVDVCETPGISMVLCCLSMQSTSCFLFFVDGVLFRTMTPSSSMFFS